MKERKLKRVLFAKIRIRPKIRILLALRKTPIILPTMKDERTLARNLIPMMKPHSAMLIPLESASMGKKELRMEEEMPDRRREKHKMAVLTQFMVAGLQAPVL